MTLLATWNLARPRSTGLRADRLRRHILDRPDALWVFTEACRGQVWGPHHRVVAESLPAPDRPAGECWVQLVVPSPLRAEPLAIGARARSAAALVASPALGPVLLIGVVLPWLTDRIHPTLRGYRAFEAALATEAARWQALMHAHPVAMAVVAGDFNQDLLPDGHYYGSAPGRARLRATLGDLGLTCLTGGEADPVAARVPGRGSIDHLSLRPPHGGLGVVVASLECWPDPQDVGHRVSDHFGVSASVTAGGSPAKPA